MQALHGRADPAPGRDHPRGDAAGDGGVLQPVEVPGLRRRHVPAPSSATPAACRPATWCRSPGCGSAGCRRSSSSRTPCWSRSRSTTASSSGTRAGPRSRCSTCSARSTSSSPRPAAASWPRTTPSRSTAPSRRTTSSASSATSTTTTERIDTDQLQQALERRLRHRRRRRLPRSTTASRGSRGSPQTVASRDEEIQALLDQLAQRQPGAGRPQRRHRRPDGQQRPGLPGAPRSARPPIHRLLVNARILADELRGLARGQPGADRARRCARSTSCSTLLNSKEKELKATLSAVGPYASILGNIIGTGPWFDAYVFNLATIPTGEFQPGLLGEE